MPYQWVPYNSVMLRNDKFYALYFDIQSIDFTQVYSTFSYRIRGQIQAGLSCVSAPLGLVEGTADTQVARLIINQYWDRNVPITVEVRRNIYYAEPSNLADTRINLKIDPTEDYNL